MNLSPYEPEFQMIVSNFGAGVLTDLELEIYDNFEDIAALREQWDSFMESINAEIFLSFDWCKIWWKYYGKKRDLLILVFRCNGNICGILPLFYEKISLYLISLRLIKMVGTDYAPVTVTMPVNKEYLVPVICKLMPTLQGKWRWDLLYVGALCGRYDALSELIHAFNKSTDNLLHIDQKQGPVQIYFDVPDSWDQYVVNLSKNQRKNLKKEFKVISDSRIAVSSTCANKTNLHTILNRFIQLHQKYWNHLGMSGHFGDWPNSISFHKEVADIIIDSDRLRLIETCFNDQPIGYEYVYRSADNYCWFLNARDESKLRNEIFYKWVSFHEMFACAVEDKVKCIDSMRGYYEYKIKMGGNAKPTNSIFIYSKDKIIAARVNLFRSIIWFINLCYIKLWRRRIAPKLKYIPGTYWEKWVRIHMLSK
jgi:CelD/BcsL family acetyltransferase involved in cellulose biosynthesis